MQSQETQTELTRADLLARVKELEVSMLSCYKAVGV